MLLSLWRGLSAVGAMDDVVPALDAVIERFHQFLPVTTEVRRNRVPRFVETEESADHVYSLRSGEVLESGETHQLVRNVGRRLIVAY